MTNPNEVGAEGLAQLGADEVAAETTVADPPFPARELFARAPVLPLARAGEAITALLDRGVAGKAVLTVD